MTTSEQGLPPRRKWLAITVATFVMLFSYLSILVAFVAGSTDDGPPPGPVFALGLALVPIVFMVLAFLSGHRRAPGAVLRAMGAALLIGVPVAAVAQDAVTGVVAGFGVGGIFTLRAEEWQGYRARAIAVFLGVLYVWVLLRVVVEAGLLAGAIVPFTVIGIADSISDRRRERTAQSAS